MNQSEPNGNNREQLVRRARERALYLLAAMPRTEQQLREKLQTSRAGYPDDVINEVLEYVKERRYVDDAAYARDYLRARASKKSRRMIFLELQRKGISRELAQEALQEWEQLADEPSSFEECQQQAIIQAIRKKRIDPSEASREEMARLYQSLARKGFTYGEIQQALKALS